MKFYEITDPVSGYIHVHGSEFQSEGEIRKEWIESLGEDHRDKVEPRKIKVREIPKNELGVPEQMRTDLTEEEMEEIYAKHRAQN